ncbi:class I SAM-dependent methyltransferase [Saccharopolyspora sp. NPDC047091]|uniref:class I SAM-dependent methyltransferase n=1 Tax=Saccharopolyspora sp. NPDC047091 TaxID=3155924 RepID=UPI0033F48930
MVTPGESVPPHEHREIAESFGADADRYDRARPHYPRAVADAVLTGLSGRRVLDVGIGTGISALQFGAAGAEVTGVEVDPRMAELARARGFTVDVARFEDWDAGARTFDAVIAGQTWHWIDPELGAAKAARVLRPGGRLALFWNVAEPEPGIASGFADVYRRSDTGLPFTPWATPALASYDAITASAVAGIAATDAFADPVRSRFDRRTTMGRAAWLDQVPTQGGHHRIPADRLAALLAELGRVVDEHGGSFTLDCATIVLTADRLPR